MNIQEVVRNKIKLRILLFIGCGNPNTSAIANRNYFNNLKNTHTTYASSHYIIGLDGEVIRCIPDNEVAFHSGSWSENRKSIGIENCHPDWGGKFNEKTYDSLIQLCVMLCKLYNININNIKTHNSITGKNCPKYYVENPEEWQKFKQDVQNTINGTVTPIPEEEKGTEEKPMYRFKNGKTIEPIYADCNHTVKIGSLNKYEECDCFGIFNGAPMVRYQVGNTGNYKIGFAVDPRCVK